MRNYVMQRNQVDSTLRQYGARYVEERSDRARRFYVYYSDAHQVWFGVQRRADGRYNVTMGRTCPCAGG